MAEAAAEPGADGRSPAAADPADAVAPSLGGGALPEGTVRLEFTYVPSAGQATAFLDAVASLRLSRLRLGAAAWELLVDPARPGEYVETFAFGSWADYVAAETVRLVDMGP